MEILFEDRFVLAVNKPSGTPSHSLKHESESERDHSVEKEVQELRGAQTLLLHRLDTGTSGVLLFAKNETIFKLMRDKFKSRSIHKFYEAWTFRSPTTSAVVSKFKYPLEITYPLAHHPKSAKRMITLPPGKNRSYRGKPLEAHTRILSTKEELFLSAPAIRLEVQIITGVMHQIRVHLQSLGLPLIGDPIYKSEIPTESKIRLGLHAKRVEFELNGFQYVIEAPLDLD